MNHYPNRRKTPVTALAFSIAVALHAPAGAIASLPLGMPPPDPFSRNPPPPKVPPPNRLRRPALSTVKPPPR